MTSHQNLTLEEVSAPRPMIRSSSSSSNDKERRRQHRRRIAARNGRHHHHRHAHGFRSSSSSAFDGHLVTALAILVSLYLLISLITFHGISSTASHVREQQLLEEENENMRQKSLQDVPPHDPLPSYPFPIQITDFDEIRHPAKPRIAIKVPAFWKPPYSGDIREYLGNYGRRLMTPTEAHSIGSFVTLNSTATSPDSKTKKSTTEQDGMLKLETIYISVASYRDYECPLTVYSIFARAKYPQRIRVAIADQRVASDNTTCKPPTDQQCAEAAAVNEGESSNPNNNVQNLDLCPYIKNIFHYEMDATLAVGPVFARHLGHRMYRGEYFAVQTDAHVRFIQDWDTSIIEQWKSAKNEMCILTTYLSDIQNHLDLETNLPLKDNRPIMCQSDFEGSGVKKHLRHGQQPEGPPGIHGEPTLEPFWAAGFSFGRGHFVTSVPYDPYLPMVFQGEEISMGLRGFTYGYDYYTPEKAVCYHIYALGDNKPKRKAVKLFWENAPRYVGVAQESMKRLNAIIGMSPSSSSSSSQPEQEGGRRTEDDYNHAEEIRYGLGQVRNTSTFFQTFGIDVKEQKVQPHLCRFVGKPMQSMFKKYLRPDRMGIDYAAFHYAFKDPIAEDGQFKPNW